MNGTIIKLVLKEEYITDSYKTETHYISLVKGIKGYYIVEFEYGKVAKRLANDIDNEENAKEIFKGILNEII
ncbi:hypothetical protein [Romboutsia sp.]|uniref:hypothetical protein n=1 Tax=Romboutsia sp. TaxID=1965302 RepID=UPI002BD68B78|nr:hypothetical protein [Romboutsia sp.]HSQ89398.1 hypothetical protein [Romboutsia sp.]